jgi:hypothetical protein
VAEWDELARRSRILEVGRFVSILRYTVAWIAGLSRMDWWRFLSWNAAGGIAWATAAGLIAYYSGRAAVRGNRAIRALRGGCCRGRGRARLDYPPPRQTMC